MSGEQEGCTPWWVGRWEGGVYTTRHASLLYTLVYTTLPTLGTPCTHLPGMAARVHPSARTGGAGRGPGLKPVINKEKGGLSAQHASFSPKKGDTLARRVTPSPA